MTNIASKFRSAVVATGLACLTYGSAFAQGPGLGSEGRAVGSLFSTASVVGGTLVGKTTGLAVVTLSAPIPYFSSFGLQIDGAYGTYDGVNANAATALAGHLFWRDPSVAMVGLYADFGELSPIHYGRLGIEGSYYSDNWTVDVLLGMEYGQNVYTRFVDEIDLSYYFTENLKGSIGHRWTARGHVANAGFEMQFAPMEYGSWSLFAEAEAGEDDQYMAFGGLKFAIGGGDLANTLIGRDRGLSVRNRIPRNLASITQCARVDVPFQDPAFLRRIGLVSQLNTTNCSSKDELNKISSTGIFNP